MILNLLAANAALVLGLMLSLWLMALRLRDVSFVDAFWAFNIVAVAAAGALLGDGDPGRRMLLAGLCAVWGLRLGVHLLRRWRGHGPDPRYVALLERFQAERGWSFGLAALLLVFLLQAPLLLVVSLPVQLGMLGPDPLGPLGWAGAALALAGVAFEAVADLQLARFRADPANRGRVLDTGLWRYSRHPNYFGDACAWWGLGLVAAESGPGPWGLVGPLLLTWMLMRWSGAPTTEPRLRRSRPGYADYIRRTSPFVPLPPRRD